MITLVKLVQSYGILVFFCQCNYHSSLSISDSMMSVGLALIAIVQSTESLIGFERIPERSEEEGEYKREARRCCTIGMVKNMFSLSIPFTSII